MPTKKEKQTFEERLDALEELVKRMEAGGMTLADTLKAYESGVKLSESLKKDFVTEDELAMAKEQLKGNYIFGQENVNSRMFSAGKNMLLMGETFTMEEVIDEIDSVTMDEVKEAADMISDISNYSAAVVTNEKINLKRIMGNL